MSYILEALRKADAERERGAVPDLQSQLLPGSSLDDESVASPLRRWLWPALGVALLAIGVVGWRFFGAPAEPGVNPPAVSRPMPPSASAPSVAPAAAATIANAASSPATAPSGAATARDAAAEVEEAELAQRAEREDSAAKAAKRAKPAKGEAKRSRSPRGGEAAKAATSPAKKAEARASPKASAKAPAASPPIAAEPPSRVPRLNELPEELRRQVPALAVGGWVYSPQVEKRMVIVNGQVFQEGALLAPELKLEQVRPKSAVFSIRGQRFEISL